LKVFGLYSDDDTPSSVADEGSNNQEAVAALMDKLAKFRDDIKTNASEDKATIFKLCD